MNTIDWQYSSLETAAEIILKINPDGHTSKSNVENYIVRLANRYLDECLSRGEKPSITGTGGWYVTLFPLGNGSAYGAEVTIQPHVVKTYLSELKQTLSNII